MAEVVHVICGAQYTSGGPGAEQAFTQAEMEVLDKRFTHALKVLGPFQRATIVTLEAESVKEAAQFCKYILKLPVTGTVAGAASPITNAEAGKKPTQTVKTTGYENTEAG